ncbi:hypothetical protein I3J27_21315 [Bradyrhizobium xenonodulans]|uniref:Uncharacterized protein n=1 Tax=Bradyrhizobium xenonodulans TaxID=2736875 RepID=A0ABY7MBC4_9BRAD|nr:hypothetical protein [Bradyrhizobium xenonodulans]WBL75575.1 hypothetical protein I3J27_21315 [Bradyrhizobium xenonodulans]
MADVLDRIIIDAFNAVIDRDMAEEAEVREEIKAKGTYWAAAEIRKLRRQVAFFRSRTAS